MALPKRTENYEALQSLFQRLCNDFGQSSGKKIIETIIFELGGLRVSIPTSKDFYRVERDRRICNRFNGTNYTELAIMFGLSVNMVRKIVNRKE